MPFVLWCFMFFYPRNRQIGVAVFFIVKITAFCEIFLYVSCEIFCYFICVVVEFLAFRVQYCGHLIFWSASVHFLIVFSGQIPHWCKFCRALISLGAGCSCLTIFLVVFCFCLCSGLSTYLISVKSIFFVVLMNHFLIFFAMFRACIFLVKNSLLNQFALARFAFFVHFFYGLVQLRFWYLHMKCFATLTCPKLFLLYSLTDFFGTRKLALFCCHDMSYQILS